MTTPAIDGNYRLRAQFDMQLAIHNGNILQMSVGGHGVGGLENAFPEIHGTINIKTKLERVSDSVMAFDWSVWGRPNAVFEPSFQAVCPRTSKNIWHEGMLFVSANADDTITITVFGFAGSDFPSHRVWVGNDDRGYLAQGPLSSLWRLNPYMGIGFVTDDGTGAFDPFCIDFP